MTRPSLVSGAPVADDGANTKIKPALTMNTISASCPPPAKDFSNGGEYVTEGMSKMQQLSAGALTPAA